MSKINVLSSKIYNRIAAGEVVERPASVVKELVENSIDAKADEITVEIADGGISSIKITDNGVGIERSELKKAIMPHATSKISSVKDLDNILSLGFRGEALASIASVSKLTIASKPKEQETGASIYSEGGSEGEINDCACFDGTEITVNNLFFNAPAREKFLKSPRSEEGEITSIMAKMILGHPEISFKYLSDGKAIYRSFGDGFESAMVCVYGTEAIKNCFLISSERNGVKINGYIGKHHYTKGNRGYQTVFLNGRNITNQTIASAISNAYSAYLMKRQYPFYVLSVEVPTEIVDVNVHPNKSDVRFSNNQIIYGAIYSIISKVLDGTGEALEIVSDKISNNQLNTDNLTKNNDRHNYENYKPESVKRFSPLTFGDKGKAQGIDFTEPKEEKPAVDIFMENKAFLEKLEAEKKAKAEAEKNEANTVIQNKIETADNLNYIGQALNTYLLFDDGENLYLADQHAAHERILFDKFVKAFESKEIMSQPLLIPFILNVNNKEYDFIFDRLSALNALGMEVSEFGKNAFKVSSLPVFAANMNPKDFFDEILSDPESQKDITAKDIMTEKLAMAACKAAVKSGDKLTDSDIEILMNALKENMGLKCPHGRPVMIKITRTEIDRWFKRIV